MHVKRSLIQSLVALVLESIFAAVNYGWLLVIYYSELRDTGWLVGPPPIIAWIAIPDIRFPSG